MATVMCFLFITWFWNTNLKLAKNIFLELQTCENWGISILVYLLIKASF